MIHLNVRFAYFLNKDFNFEPCRFDGCHDLLQEATSFDKIAIVSVKGNSYTICFLWCK